MLLPLHPHNSLPQTPKSQLNTKLPHPPIKVLDGVFAGLKINKFNYTTYGKYAHIYNGSSSTGLLRGPKNLNVNPMLTRYPVKNVAAAAVVREPQGSEAFLHGHSVVRCGEASGDESVASLVWLYCGEFLCVSPFLCLAYSSILLIYTGILQAFKTFAVVAATLWANVKTGMAAGLGMSYTKADYERCFDATQFVDWMEWNYCCDLTSFVFAFNNSARFNRYTSSMSPTLHAGLWSNGRVS